MSSYARFPYEELKNLAVQIRNVQAQLQAKTLVGKITAASIEYIEEDRTTTDVENIITDIVTDIQTLSNTLNTLSEDVNDLSETVTTLSVDVNDISVTVNDIVNESDPGWNSVTGGKLFFRDETDVLLPKVNV